MVIFFFFLFKNRKVTCCAIFLRLFSKTDPTTPCRLCSATASRPDPKKIHHPKGEEDIPSPDFLPSAHEDVYRHSGPAPCAAQAPIDGSWAKVVGQDVRSAASGCPHVFAHCQGRSSLGDTEDTPLPQPRAPRQSPHRPVTGPGSAAARGDPPG